MQAFSVNKCIDIVNKCQYIVKTDVLNKVK